MCYSDVRCQKVVGNRHSAETRSSMSRMSAAPQHSAHGQFRTPHAGLCQNTMLRWSGEPSFPQKGTCSECDRFQVVVRICRLPSLLHRAAAPR
jgi:hypothetical protein